MVSSGGLTRVLLPLAGLVLIFALAVGGVAQAEPDAHDSKAKAKKPTNRKKATVHTFSGRDGSARFVVKVRFNAKGVPVRVKSLTVRNMDALCGGFESSTINVNLRDGAKITSSRTKSRSGRSKIRTYFNKTETEGANELEISGDLAAPHKSFFLSIDYDFTGGSRGDSECKARANVEVRRGKAK